MQRLESDERARSAHVLQYWSLTRPRRWTASCQLLVLQQRPLALLLQFHPAAQGVEVRSRDPDASDAGRLGERSNELEWTSSRRRPLSSYFLSGSCAFPLGSSSWKLAQPNFQRSRGRSNTDRLLDQQRMAQAPSCTSGIVRSSSVSPDGRRFVYNTAEGLYLRSMDALGSGFLGRRRDADFRSGVEGTDDHRHGVSPLSRCTSTSARAVYPRIGRRVPPRRPRGQDAVVEHQVDAWRRTCCCVEARGPLRLWPDPLAWQGKLR